jgi:hypothetical protein
MLLLPRKPVGRLLKLERWEGGGACGGGVMLWGGELGGELGRELGGEEVGLQVEFSALCLKPCVS